jgi:hypothetical protein
MALTFSMIQNAKTSFGHDDQRRVAGCRPSRQLGQHHRLAGFRHMLILAKTSDILFADDGQTEIDASDQASIEMLDNPTNNAATGGPTTMVSMYQTNSVAVKAVRFVNWKKKRSGAVSFIKEAAYVAA